MDNYKPQPMNTQVKKRFKRLKESSRANSIRQSVIWFLAYAELKREIKEELKKRIEFKEVKFTFADLAEIEMEEVEVIED